MLKNQLIARLQSFGISPEQYGEFLRFPCPFRKWTHKEKGAGDGNDVYSLSTKTLKGRCFVCGDRSNLDQLLLFKSLFEKNKDDVTRAINILDEEKNDLSIDSAYEGLQMRLEIKEEEENKKHLLGLQELCCSTLSTENVPELKNYLEHRGFDWEFIRFQFNLKYDIEEFRVLIPHVDFYTGEFLGVEGRTSIGEKPKTKHYAGTKTMSTFLTPSFLHEDCKAYLLVEGPFDLFRLWENSNDCEIIPMALSGSSLSNQQLSILETEYKSVFTLFDNDAAGISCGNITENKLTGKVPLVLKLNLPPGKQDPDEMNKEEIDTVFQYIKARI